MSEFDPDLDLRFSRVVDVPRASVWRAWTEPLLLMPWFCPLPWKTIACEIDLRPGGAFRTTMQSPEGQTFNNEGCYLVVNPGASLMWTNALTAGFRPALIDAGGGSEPARFRFTATIHLSDAPEGTLYSACVSHADAAACKQHAAMGFEEGWSAALDQLVAMIKLGV